MSKPDLVVLSADLDIEQLMKTLLERRAAALGVRSIQVTWARHIQRDSGCYGRPDAVLGNASIADRALVLFDTAFDGHPDLPAGEMARRVESRLAPSWGDRARAVAIAPEVEVWLWDGHHVVEALHWKGDHQSLRSSLAAQGLWSEGDAKPSDPKRALDKVIARTSPGVKRGIFEHVAARASVERCTDPSFRRLCTILREWFPA